MVKNYVNIDNSEIIAYGILHKHLMYVIVS